MRIDRDEYRQAKGCLTRYTYNCLRINELRNDILSISGVNYNTQPKAPYSISDSVFNTYERLCEDKELNKVVNECKAVNRALALLTEDHSKILTMYFQQRKSKYIIMCDLCISESTFKRRLKDLIEKVAEELKKMN